MATTKSRPKHKKRKLIPTKTPMPEQDPMVRIHNFNEVPKGYTE